MIHTDSKRLKILFVQDAFGKLSEAFLYRINTRLLNINVEVLTGEYINQDAFPFDKSKMTIWGKSTLIQKVRGKVNASLNLSGSHSGIGYKIVELINKSDADIVCFQFAFLPVNMGSTLKDINKKVCVLHHGSDVNVALENYGYRERIQNVWKVVYKAIFVSHFLKGVGQKVGCPQEKSIVNYLGVPIFAEQDGYKKTNDVFEFICVARLTPVKNHLRLIEAFAKVVDSIKINIKLTLIGAGELEKQIKEKIKEYNLETEINMLGGLPNQHVLSLVSKADCTVLISQVYIEKGKSRAEEGLPISLLEGAAMGLPMIGSNTGGIPEIIKDEMNGYIVDPLNVDDIAKAMIKLVSNPEKARSMGQKSKLLVEKKFDLSRQLKNFEKIYEEMVK